VLADINEPVNVQLERYGLAAALGPDARFDAAGEMLEQYGNLTAGSAHPEDERTQ
jgi:hypothetical protein